MSKKKKVKEKPKFNVWLRLAKYLFKRPIYISIVIATVLIYNILLIIVPALSGNAIDIIEAGVRNGNLDTTINEVYLLVAIMLGMYIVSAALTYSSTFMFSKIGQNVAYTLRGEVLDKVLKLSAQSLSKYQTGEIISRLTYDIGVVSTSITGDFMQVITSTIGVVGSVGIMFAISPYLFLIYLLILPCAFFFSKYIIDFVKPLFRIRSKAIGELCRYIEEKVSGTKTIRAYCAEEFYCDEFAGVNKKSCDSQYKAEYYASTMFPMMSMLTNLTLTLIALVGITLYLASMITLGSISTFILYSRRFLASVNEYSNIVSDLQSAAAASERIFNLLDEENESDIFVRSDKKLEGDISFENVSFGYNSEQIIIKDFSLEIKKGQTVAIVGETGSGKTTLISLLMRFYDINSGKIKINGVDINSVPRAQVRENFGVVLQNSWIFNDTVYGNIAYTDEEAGQNKVEKAAISANVHDIITAMPMGYKTVLSENAGNMSKGQKQLVAIARSIIQEAPMLILDEATSNVDTATEKRISEAMLNLRKGKTSFIIAHRLSTIMDADVIVVLKQGEIVEKGTHDELLKSGGEYSRIYESQFV